MSTTFTTPTLTGHPSAMTPPDPEVPDRPARRRFKAEYKVAILAEIDQAPSGEIGAILRREGLYSSLITTWRTQRKEGSLAALQQRRGPKPDPLAKENAKLRRENEKLRRDLENARLVIDVQKKVSRLLQTPEHDEAN